jgi:hypothetical protein
LIAVKKWNRRVNIFITFDVDYQRKSASMNLVLHIGIKHHLIALVGETLEILYLGTKKFIQIFVWVVVKIILKSLAKRTEFSALSVIPDPMKTAFSSTVIVNNPELREKQILHKIRYCMIIWP